mmetsp:Transcript_65428/g.117825  ORF Transcript_65428/g.117825 Transcript_65428/m.117825 type:complete len:224 (+) Transcript_65428:1491-2162(+)
MARGCHILHVLDALELSALISVEEVHTAKLHQLSCELVCHLVSPLVDQGHRCVVQEDGEPLAARRTESLARLPLHLSFNCPLQSERCRGAAKVHPLGKHAFHRELLKEHHGCGGLGCPSSPHHEYRSVARNTLLLPHLGHDVDHVLRAARVHCRNEQRREEQSLRHLPLCGSPNLPRPVSVKPVGHVLKDRFTVFTWRNNIPVPSLRHDLAELAVKFPPSIRL